MNRVKQAIRQLATKWAVPGERRQIIAFAAAGTFLLFSSWNSFEDKRLKSDIGKAELRQRIQSGRMSQDWADGGDWIVLHAEINELGQVKVTGGADGSNARKVEELKVTPMTINGKPAAASVPIAVPLESDEEKR